MGSSVFKLEPRQNAQVTVGTLVLICKENAEAFADVSADAYSEMKQVSTRAPFSILSPHRRIRA